MDLLQMHDKKLATPQLLPLRNRPASSSWLRGLQTAERAENPHGKARVRKKSKLDGLRFERAVAGKLGGEHNPWFRYLDGRGWHYCSPDLLLDTGDFVLLVEVKLSDVAVAWSKLLGLYAPIVELVLAKPVVPVVVVKNLTPASKLVVTTLAEAVSQWKQQPTLHWLGRGPFPWG